MTRTGHDFQITGHHIRTPGHNSRFTGHEFVSSCGTMIDFFSSFKLSEAVNSLDLILLFETDSFVLLFYVPILIDFEIYVLLLNHLIFLS
jgi:hypothetical protein